MIDACLALSPQQLESAVPGTYGSIIQTMRHLVGSDGWDLFTVTGDRATLIDESKIGLVELRAAIESNGAAWSRLLGRDELDPGAVLREVDEDDGFQRDASLALRLAQALHHGTDHRSQVCTALTALGVSPPRIDVWTFALQVGRITEKLPNA